MLPLTSVPPSAEQNLSKPVRKALFWQQPLSSKQMIDPGRTFLCTKLNVCTEPIDLASTLDEELAAQRIILI